MTDATEQVEADDGLDSAEPPGEERKRKKKRRSKKRKAVFALVTLLLFLILCELTARVVSYVYYDFNTYYLFYGSKAWKTDDGHSRKFDGYFKFPPDSKIHISSTEPPATINNHGFRGPDFEASKPPGVFRILCLGASSTYGYLNGDSDTYPAILRRLFRENRSDLSVEIVNCGITHMNTSNVLAMLEQELLEYAPDLITLYTGYNDATWPLDETALQAFQRWMDEHSAAYAALRKVMMKLGASMHHRYADYLPQTDAATAERQVELHEEMTRNNVTRMMDIARDNDIGFVLIRQPIRAHGDQRIGNYERDYRRISDALEQNGEIPGTDMALYVHHHLDALLVDLARRRGVPVVDNVALTDEHPTALASAVHLTAAANARLASRLYACLEPLVRTR